MDEFRRVSFAEMGQRWPDATVLYDRDIAPAVKRPLVLRRWGHLYVASLDSDSVCWCWMSDSIEWEDLTGGYWLYHHRHLWLSAISSAIMDERAIAASKGVPI